MYIDGELKIRQYNQWDSYPTGQFQDLCDILRRVGFVEELYKRLLTTVFFTKEEVEEICNHEWWKEEGAKTSPYYAADYFFMTHRDWGANILPLIVMMPYRYYLDRTASGDLVSLKIADWAMVFDVPDLEDEEGNYYVAIDKRNDHEFAIRIGGEYHGIRREWNHIPEDWEITEWYAEANDKD